MSFSYDVNGDLTTATNMEGNATTFTYDDAGRLDDHPGVLCRHPAERRLELLGGVLLLHAVDEQAQLGQLTVDCLLQDRFGNNSRQTGCSAGTGGTHIRQFSTLRHLFRYRQDLNCATMVESRLPYFFSFCTVDQHHGVFSNPVQHPGSRNRHQAVIGHDDQVRMTDDAAFIDGGLIGAYIGENRCTTSFRTIAWCILHFVAFEKESSAENAAGSLHTLATSTMETDSVHFSCPVSPLYPAVCCRE